MPKLTQELLKRVNNEKGSVTLAGQPIKNIVAYPDISNHFLSFKGINANTQKKSILCSSSTKTQKPSLT